MKLILMSKHDTNLLTADLAIWWLCMLALSSPENRCVASKEEIAKINEWGAFRDDQGQRKLRHRSSLREKPMPAARPRTMWSWIWTGKIWARGGRHYIVMISIPIR